MFRIVFIAGVLNFMSFAQENLTHEIMKVDSIFFTAFNNRNIEAIENLFSKDLEFYHDVTGLTGYEKNLEATKYLFEMDNGLYRKLVDSKIYKIDGYGGLQIGTHTFCHDENGMEDCGTFEFIHLWKRTEEGWKLARVISYNH
jgi:ketosteroid isomerase-like protein